MNVWNFNDITRYLGEKTALRKNELFLVLHHFSHRIIQLDYDTSVNDYFDFNHSMLQKVRFLGRKSDVLRQCVKPKSLFYHFICVCEFLFFGWILNLDIFNRERIKKYTKMFANEWMRFFCLKFGCVLKWYYFCNFDNVCVGLP